MAEEVIAEACPRVDCSNLTQAQLEPYPDISGDGVLIGFIGTAYLVLLLVLVNFIVAYDPEKDPFRSRRAQAAEIDDDNWWQPNPIDLRLLRFIRRWKLLSSTHETAARLWVAFDEAIISLGDIQLVTGLGILISCYMLLQCALDAYHWQIAMYLAWFSTVTHLSGLTVLRSYLNTYAWTKYIRYSLMLSLLVLLLVGLVPTGYFTPNSTYSAPPALCFFRLGYDYWKMRVESPPDPALEMTGQWQAMVFSIVQLVFGFVTRSVKLFQPMSRAIRNGIRRPLSDQSKKLLLVISRSRASKKHLDILKVKLVLKPALAVFFACRITADMFSSTFFEVYWLFSILLWGTVKVLGARNEVGADKNSTGIIESQRQWTFGQILPVLLLIGPIFTTAGIFGYHLTKEEPPTWCSQPGSRDMEESLTATRSQMMRSSNDETDIPLMSIGGTDISCAATDPTSPMSNKSEIPYLDNYTDAPWLATCVAVPFLGLLAGTMLAFAMVFNFVLDFTMQWTLREVWIDEYNFAFVLFVSYPCACVSSIRLGLGLEDGTKKTPALRFHIFWYFCLCSVIYTIYFLFPVYPFLFDVPNGNNPAVVIGLGGLYLTVILYVCHAGILCIYVGRK